jgi:hypothetical protein
MDGSRSSSARVPNTIRARLTSEVREINGEVAV